MATSEQDVVTHQTLSQTSENEVKIEDNSKAAHASYKSDPFEIFPSTLFSTFVIFGLFASLTIEVSSCPTSICPTSSFHRIIFVGSLAWARP